MSDLNELREISAPSALPRKTSGLAIASLVCGVTAWTILPIFLNAIAAVIIGRMAKKEIKASNGSLTGDGLATAGLILGWVQIALFIVAVAIITVLALIAPGFSS